MANFKTSLARLRIAEGGYQVHPSDPGNYNSRNQLVGTNHGINAKVYESWIGEPPTAADMRAMPWTTAAEIFRVRYWNKILGDQIKNQSVADLFLDGKVNHGAGIKLLQEVLGVAIDGIVGTQTITAINAANPAWLFHAYKERRRRYYHYLVERDPRLQAFLQGWMNRLDRFDDFPSGGGSGGSGSPPTSSDTNFAALLPIGLFFIIIKNTTL